MEKVYQPCILQTKKRYVGFAYETAEQQEPVFDAKGIETIRWGVMRGPGNSAGRLRHASQKKLW
jgi:DNA polymerase elongation subunit (family B)